MQFFRLGLVYFALRSAVSYTGNGLNRSILEKGEERNGEDGEREALLQRNARADIRSAGPSSAESFTETKNRSAEEKERRIVQINEKKWRCSAVVIEMERDGAMCVRARSLFAFVRWVGARAD